MYREFQESSLFITSHLVLKSASRPSNLCDTTCFSKRALLGKCILEHNMSQGFKKPVHLQGVAYSAVYSYCLRLWLMAETCLSSWTSCISCLSQSLVWSYQIELYTSLHWFYHMHRVYIFYRESMSKPSKLSHITQHMLL